jgi:hypothetical protein
MRKNRVSGTGSSGIQVAERGDAETAMAFAPFTCRTYELGRLWRELNRGKNKGGFV